MKLLKCKKCDRLFVLLREGNVEVLDGHLEELKANTKITDEKVDKILTILTKASSVNFFLNKVIDTKYFWLWLVIITGLIFGVNFEKIMEIFR